jgi:hypothetical protein
MSCKLRFRCDLGRNEATENLIPPSAQTFSMADYNNVRSLDSLSEKMHIVRSNHYVSG